MGYFAQVFVVDLKFIIEIGVYQTGLVIEITVFPL